MSIKDTSGTALKYSIQFNTALFQVCPEKTEVKGLNRLTKASALRSSEQVYNTKRKTVTLKTAHIQKMNYVQNGVVMRCYDSGDYYSVTEIQCYKALLQKMLQKRRIHMSLLQMNH